MSKVLCGDALEMLKTLPTGSVNMCVTSPPYYGLRDYGIDGQLGTEDAPALYIERLVGIFREVYRVLRKDGTLWINIADSYAGSGKGGWDSPIKNGISQQQYNPKAFNMPKKWKGIKAKDMIGIPWSLAFSLRDDGWYLRSDIIWQKPNCMPESVKDRPSKSYEHIFLLAKSKKYYYDYEAIQEPVAPETVARLKRAVSDAGKYANGVEGQPMQAIFISRDHSKERTIRKAVIAGETKGHGYGILSPIAQNAIRDMRDMMLRPDVYAQAEEQLKVLLADIIKEVENGMDMNTAIKAAYEKIYQSVNPSFNYDEQFSLDTCYRDIPAVDMAMFNRARKLLNDAKNK